MTHPLPLQTASIDITDFAMPRDLGVGRYENRVVFVPGAVPGDRVRVELVREGKSFTYGKLAELESPSVWRRDPPCPHFGSCGGCSLLHLDYHQQLEIKRGHLLETFRRVGGLEIDPQIIVPITPSKGRLYYRGKIELTCQRQRDETVLGLKKRLSPFEPYTGEVIAVDSCAIFSPVAASILPVLRHTIRGLKLPAFDEGAKRGFLKGVAIRESKSTGQVMVVLETSRGQLRGAESLIASLRQSVPSLQTISWSRDGRLETLSGPGWIEERIEDLRFRIVPEVFFQPNPEMARLLYQKVVDFARSVEARRIMGLYCGMGTLEMMLSRHVDWIEGFDADPQNIGNARYNCKMNGLSNCRFHAKRIEEIGSRHEGGASFDMAVVDPPRTGMSKTAIESLRGMNPPAIAYVSCDPATLARDLKFLTGAGYFLVHVAPFDFFPHTSHLETLVLLKKK